MVDANLNIQWKAAKRRTRSPLAWVVGALFFVALMGLLILYFGFTNKFNEAVGAGSTKPTTPTQQEQQRK